MAVFLVVGDIDFEGGELHAAFRRHARGVRLLLRDDGLEFQLAKLHVGAEAEEGTGAGDERGVAGERDVAAFDELDDFVFLAFVFQLHALGVEVESGVGVVVDVHVHLVAYLAVDAEVDFLVEVKGGGLAVADGQRGVVDVLERGAKLQFRRSLGLDAHAARAEDFLGRAEVEMHVGEVELLLPLALGDFFVLRLEKLVHGAALAPLEILVVGHHRGRPYIGASHLVADDVAVEGVVVLHRLLHVLRALEGTVRCIFHRGWSRESGISPSSSTMAWAAILGLFLSSGFACSWPAACPWRFCRWRVRSSWGEVRSGRFCRWRVRSSWGTDKAWPAITLMAHINMMMPIIRCLTFIVLSLRGGTLPCPLSLYLFQCQFHYLFHGQAGMLPEDFADHLCRRRGREAEHREGADGLAAPLLVDRVGDGGWTTGGLLGQFAARNAVLEVDDDALCRALADALDVFQRALVAAGDDIAQFGRRQRREYHPRRVGAYAGNGDEQPVELALPAGGKTIEGEGVVSPARDNSLMYKQLHRLLCLDGRISIERNVQRISNSSRFDNGYRWGDVCQFAPDVFYH